MWSRRLSGLLLVSAACTGSIFEPARPVPAVPDEPPAKVFEPAPATLRMLTTQQYVNAAVQLGAQNPVPPPLSSGSVAAAYAVANDALVQDVETRSLFIAHGLVTDAAWVASSASCDLTAAACRREVIARVGERAFRRVMQPDELDDYAALFDGEATRFADPTRGLEFVIAAFLQSPQFVFRVELDDGSNHFDSAALAGRIAFLLTDAPPDDALRADAASGLLADPMLRRQHAERLLAGTTGHRGVRRFFEDWLQLDKLSSLEKSATAFPTFSSAMAEAMREQAARTAERLAYSGTDIRGLFDDTGADVNAALGPVYDASITDADGWVHLSPAMLGARPGLLGWPALLALHAKPNKTSVTDRGVFLRKDVLCGVVPLPPQNVPPLPTPMAGEMLTTRQLFERHRAVEPCKTCHTLFDPMGITLETFDGMGHARTMENGLPIDPSGDLDGVPIATAMDLAAAMRARPDVEQCLVSHVHAYAAGHQAGEPDSPFVHALAEHLATNGHDFQTLLLDYVSSDEFTQTRKAP